MSDPYMSVDNGAKEDKTARAAKFMNQMLKSLQDAAMSGIPEAIALMESFKVLAPILGPFKALAEVFAMAIQAGMMDAIIAINEQFLTEENVQIAISLGTAIGKTFGEDMKEGVKTTKMLGDNIRTLTQPLKDMNAQFDKMGVHMEITLKWVGRVSNALEVMSGKLSSVASVAEDVKEVFDELKELMEDMA